MRKGENIYKRKDGCWEIRAPAGRTDRRASYRSLYDGSYAEAKKVKASFSSYLPSKFWSGLGRNARFKGMDRKIS